MVEPREGKMSLLFFYLLRCQRPLHFFFIIRRYSSFAAGSAVTEGSQWA